MPAKYLAARTVDLKTGRVVPLGAEIEASDIDPEDPHDAALLADAAVIERPKPRKSREEN
jgi:hypothetical protein